MSHKGNNTSCAQLKKYNTKSIVHERKKLLSWTFALWKTLLREWKDKSDWKKILAKHISDKGLVPQTYKELLKVKNGKTRFKNRQKKHLRHLTKEYIQMANNHTTQHHTSLGNYKLKQQSESTAHSFVLLWIKIASPLSSQWLANWHTSICWIKEQTYMKEFTEDTVKHPRWRSQYSSLRRTFLFLQIKKCLVTEY